MGNKLPLIMGIHCHQPYENFHHVVDYAVKVSYAPFIEVALKNKSLKFAVHYSGWLLDFIRVNHKDLFNKMKKCYDNGQIEFFTGGYYEPILTTIPSDDRRGQINKLSDYIANYFGERPKGLWLTERVWDPMIIPDLYECGVETIVVDDYHLLTAGVDEKDIKGYFRTEQDGCPINILPVDKTMRYATPFKPEGEILDYLKELKNADFKLVTYFDDGEKFGLWPSTYEWVYEKGWLERFIETIVSSEDVEFAHYRDIIKTVKPEGLAYMPITSYVEMGEWSLNANGVEKFSKIKDCLKHNIDNLHISDTDIDTYVRGGVWKNFLVKYSEANRIHKKALNLSLKGKKHKNDEIFKEHLYQSQCNDALWHGLFGGLYLPNLRNNLWGSIILTQKRFEELERIKPDTIEIADIDLDGYDEAYYIGAKFNALFASKNNGQLTSLELKDKNFNILNTLTRRKEGYHSHINFVDTENNDECKIDEVKNIHDSNLEIDSCVKDFLEYDWYDRSSFIDHFTYDFSVENFKRVNFIEIGDFVNQCSKLELNNDKITFKRDGSFNTSYGVTPVVMSKQYTCKKDIIDFKFDIKSSAPFECQYVSEMNFHFANSEAVTINGEKIDGHTILTGKKFIIKDDYTAKNIILEYAEEVELGSFLVHTVSQSEIGVELTVQGIAILAKIDFNTSLSFKGKFYIEDYK